MEDIYEAVIVGCGVSGIAASNVLLEHGVEHVIIEAQPYIGGRIAGSELQGLSIDLGAMIVHHPYENNPIRELMDRMNIKYSSKDYKSQQIMVGLNRELSTQTKNKAYEIYKSILQKMQLFAQESINDVSIQQATKQSIDIANIQLSRQGRDYITLLLQIHANIQGADLSQISAKYLYFDNPEDVVPQQGFYSFIEKMYEMYPRNALFEQKVFLIDYREDYIEITTDKKVIRAKNLISSIPLGCLKRKMVKFIPPLSSQKEKAIQNIGFGVFNKVIVSFQNAFWDTSKQYILLVSNNPSQQGFFRLRATIKDGRYILWAFVSGSKSKRLSKLDDNSIVHQFIDVLSCYYPRDLIKVKSYLVTRWNENKLFNGSYSYFKAGSTSIRDFQELRKPIEDRIWFVGEHCTTGQVATVHGAYQSGVQAAQSLAAKLSHKKQSILPKCLP